MCVCVWEFCIGVQDAWLCAWENVSKAAKKITFHFIQIQNFLLLSLSACVCVCFVCVCICVPECTRPTSCCAALRQ